jgi:hypothetical protein
MVYNNKLQRSIKLAYEIKQQLYLEQLTVVPIVLSVSQSLVWCLCQTPCIRVFKLRSAEEGVTSKMQRASVFGVSTLAAGLSVLRYN